MNMLKDEKYDEAAKYVWTCNATLENYLHNVKTAKEELICAIDRARDMGLQVTINNEQLGERSTVTNITMIVGFKKEEKDNAT